MDGRHEGVKALLSEQHEMHSTPSTFTRYRDRQRPGDVRRVDSISVWCNLNEIASINRPTCTMLLRPEFTGAIMDRSSNSRRGVIHARIAALSWKENSLHNCELPFRIGAIFRNAENKSHSGICRLHLGTRLQFSNASPIPNVYRIPEYVLHSRMWSGGDLCEVPPWFFRGRSHPSCIVMPHAAAVTKLQTKSLNGSQQPPIREYETYSRTDTDQPVTPIYPLSLNLSGGVATPDKPKGPGTLVKDALPRGTVETRVRGRRQRRVAGWQVSKIFGPAGWLEWKPSRQNPREGVRGIAWISSHRTRWGWSGKGTRTLMPHCPDGSRPSIRSNGKMA